MEIAHTRVVGKVHAFVTELTSDLVHTVQATNSEHLEIQLRSNTQEHVHVQVVVVSDKRLGSSTASNSVKHGGLDSDEVPVIKPSADEGVDLGTSDKNVAGLVVHHQVQVTLAETLLGVLETVVVVGDLNIDEYISIESDNDGEM